MCHWRGKYWDNNHTLAVLLAFFVSIAMWISDGSTTWNSHIRLRDKYSSSFQFISCKMLKALFDVTCNNFNTLQTFEQVTDVVDWQGSALDINVIYRRKEEKRLNMWRHNFTVTLMICFFVDSQSTCLCSLQYLDTSIAVC